MSRPNEPAPHPGRCRARIADADGQVAKRYGLAGVPTHFFMGPGGVIRGVSVGVLTRAQMDAELTRLTG